MAERGHMIADAVLSLVEIPSHVGPRRVGQGGGGGGGVMTVAVRL